MVGGEPEICRKFARIPVFCSKDCLFTRITAERLRPDVPGIGMGILAKAQPLAVPIVSRLCMCVSAQCGEAF